MEQLNFDYINNIEPQILISFVFGFFITILAIISQILKRKTERELTELLSNDSIRSCLTDKNSNIYELINFLRAKQEKKGFFSNICQKISNDISWDVSGIIGIFVTIALLIMTIAGASDQIPKDIFTGWLIILGYYFGKGRSSSS